MFVNTAGVQIGKAQTTNQAQYMMIVARNHGLEVVAVRVEREKREARNLEAPH